MPDTPIDLATMSLRQLQVRIARARHNHTHGKWDEIEANARLFPWIAAAIRCGANPTAIHADLAIQLADRMNSGLHEGAARHLVALTLAADDDVAGEVALARDHAVKACLDHSEGGTERQRQNAEDLTAMAARLCAPPHEPRKDAA